MGLRELLARDGAVLTQSAHMGETVAFRPKDGGGPFTIPALVTRQPPDARPESDRSRKRVARVTIRNNADTSLGRSFVDEHGDKMDVVLEVGQAAVTARITNVIYADEMFWQLEVTG
jgi:hypothetical protein